MSKTTKSKTPAPDTEAGLFKRASAAYKRALTGNAVQQEPSQGSSGLEGGVYVLRNTRGELARFRYDASADRLFRLAT
jgi:hypothetical protein